MKLLENLAKGLQMVHKTLEEFESWWLSNDDDTRIIIDLFDTAQWALQYIAELGSTTIPFLVMTENQALKERIAELEAPKSCDGCIYLNEEEQLCEISTWCDRNKIFIDRYEPKDK